MFWLYAIYGNTNFFLFLFLATSPRTHCRITSFKIYKNVSNILKYFVDVGGPFYVCKMVEIHHPKKISYIINIYFKFSKNMDKVYINFKD